MDLFRDVNSEWNLICRYLSRTLSEITVQLKEPGADAFLTHDEQSSDRVVLMSAVLESLFQKYKKNPLKKRHRNVR